MTKPKVIMLLLALFMAMHTTCLFAQPAMSWPMQQGESVTDIARLFYPKNSDMQRQFIATTLKLNQDVRPNLDSKTVFAQGDSIVIPDIKWLSRFSKDRQPQAAVSKKSLEAVDTAFLVSATQQQQLDDLIQRNVLFKQQLDALTAKLAHVEAIFAGLKANLLQLINRPEPVKPEPVEPVVVKAEPVKEPVPIEAQAVAEPQLAPQTVLVQEKKEQVASPAAEEAHKPIAPVKKPSPPAQVNPAENANPAEKTATLHDAQQLSSSPLYWVMPLLIALLIIGFYLALDRLNKWRHNKKSVAKNDENVPISQESFDISYPSEVMVEFTTALPHSKFSDSILQLIPELEEVLDEKEEAELMLNQAKIYEKLKRYDNAIQLLKVYIKAAPKSALPHWFFLLDIYRKTNQQEAFLETASQLHQAFNVELLQWKPAEERGGNGPSQQKHSLEDYDYIVSKVTKLWMDCEKEASNLAQIKGYIDKLLTDNRGSQRTGFSADVFEDLMLLRDTLVAREKLAKDLE